MAITERIDHVVRVLLKEHDNHYVFCLLPTHEFEERCKTGEIKKIITKRESWNRGTWTDSKRVLPQWSELWDRPWFCQSFLELVPNHFMYGLQSINLPHSLNDIVFNENNPCKNDRILHRAEVASKMPCHENILPCIPVPSSINVPLRGKLANNSEVDMNNEIFPCVRSISFPSCYHRSSSIAIDALKHCSAQCWIYSEPHPGLTTRESTEQFTDDSFRRMVVQELKFVGTVIPKYRECKDSISFLGAVLTSLEKLSEQLLVQSVDDSSGYQEDQIHLLNPDYGWIEPELLSRGELCLSLQDPSSFPVNAVPIGQRVSSNLLKSFDGLLSNFNHCDTEKKSLILEYVVHRCTHFILLLTPMRMKTNELDVHVSLVLLTVYPNVFPTFHQHITSLYQSEHLSKEVSNHGGIDCFELDLGNGTTIGNSDLTDGSSISPNNFPDNNALLEQLYWDIDGESYLNSSHGKGKIAVMAIKTFDTNGLQVTSVQGLCQLLKWMCEDRFSKSINVRNNSNINEKCHDKKIYELYQHVIYVFHSDILPLPVTYFLDTGFVKDTMNNVSIFLLDKAAVDVFSSPTTNNTNTFQNRYRISRQSHRYWDTLTSSRSLDSSKDTRDQDMNKNSGRALLSECKKEYLGTVSESNSRVDSDGEVDDSVISGNSRRMKCKKSRYHAYEDDAIKDSDMDIEDEPDERDALLEPLANLKYLNPSFPQELNILKREYNVVLQCQQQDVLFNIKLGDSGAISLLPILYNAHHQSVELCEYLCQMMFLLGDDRQFASCASPCGQVIGKRSEAKRVHDILRMSCEGREDICDIYLEEQIMDPQLACDMFAQNIQRLLDCDAISMVCSMIREHCQDFIVKNDHCDVEECKVSKLTMSLLSSALRLLKLIISNDLKRSIDRSVESNSTITYLNKSDIEKSIIPLLYNGSFCGDELRAKKKILRMLEKTILHDLCVTFFQNDIQYATEERQLLENRVRYALEQLLLLLAEVAKLSKTNNNQQTHSSQSNLDEWLTTLGCFIESLFAANRSIVSSSITQSKDRSWDELLSRLSELSLHVPIVESILKLFSNAMAGPCSHRNRDKNTASSTIMSIRKYVQSIIESQYSNAIQLWNLLDAVTSSNNSGERLIDHEPMLFLELLDCLCTILIHPFTTTVVRDHDNGSREALVKRVEDELTSMCPSIGLIVGQATLDDEDNSQCFSSQLVRILLTHCNAFAKELHGLNSSTDEIDDPFFGSNDNIPNEKIGDPNKRMRTMAILNVISHWLFHIRSPAKSFLAQLSFLNWPLVTTVTEAVANHDLVVASLGWIALINLVGNNDHVAKTFIHSRIYELIIIESVIHAFPDDFYRDNAYLCFLHLLAASSKFSDVTDPSSQRKEKRDLQKKFVTAGLGKALITEIVTRSNIQLDHPVYDHVNNTNDCTIRVLPLNLWRLLVAICDDNDRVVNRLLTKGVIDIIVAGIYDRLMNGLSSKQNPSNRSHEHEDDGGTTSDGDDRDFMIEEFTLVKYFLQVDVDCNGQCHSLLHSLPSLGFSIVKALQLYEPTSERLTELLLEILDILFSSLSQNCQFFVNDCPNDLSSAFIGILLLVLNRCTTATHINRCLVILVLSVFSTLVQEVPQLLSGSFSIAKDQKKSLHSLHDVLVKCLSVPDIYLIEKNVKDAMKGKSQPPVVELNWGMIHDILIVSRACCYSRVTKCAKEIEIISLAINLIEFYPPCGNTSDRLDSDVISFLVEQCLAFLERQVQSSSVKGVVEGAHFLFQLLRLSQPFDLLKVPLKKKLVQVVQQSLSETKALSVLSQVDNMPRLASWIDSIETCLPKPSSSQDSDIKVKSASTKEIDGILKVVKTMLIKHCKAITAASSSKDIVLRNRNNSQSISK